MFGNYLKIAIKVLLRRRFFTFISLFGIGFTLVALMIVTALFDGFVSPSAPDVNLDRTLEVGYMEMSGESYRWNGAPGFGFLDRYARNLDGVENMAIHRTAEAVSIWDGDVRHEFQLKRADGPFWEILDFTFLEGGPFTATDDDERRLVAVITDRARRTLFGSEAALGRTVDLGNGNYEIIGVVEGVGRLHTLIMADIYAPISTTADSDFRTKLMGECRAILLAESKDAFPRIQDDFRSRLGTVEFDDPENWNKLTGTPQTRLQEVASSLTGDRAGGGRVDYFFGLVALLMLAFMALPAINLVNINLSRIYERAPEIGVRKAFGASARHLVGQFVLENVVLCIVGGTIGFALAAVALGAVEASGALPIENLRFRGRVFSAGMGFAILFGILSGLYPAWRMSRMQPVAALKGGDS